MTVLCATDLDRTLIYSAGAIERWGGPDELVAVERHLDRDASFATAAAADGFAELTRAAHVVPVTTRTVAQLERVRLPGVPSRWAVAANGGVLLENGVRDEQWSRTVAHRLRGAATLREMTAEARAACGPEWTSAVRTAEDLFCYAVVDRDALPDDVVDEQRDRAAARGWTVSLQGRKLYWVPASLTKSAAVAEIAGRCGAGATLAAGDSLLDVDLLASADAGIMARHGELAASGWQAEHVVRTRSCGVAAGAEVVAWFVARTAEG